MSEEHSMLEVERSNLANGFTGIKRMLSNSSIDYMNHVGGKCSIDDNHKVSYIIQKSKILIVCSTDRDRDLNISNESKRPSPRNFQTKFF